MEDRFDARLLDGKSARPIVGRVHLRHDTIVFERSGSAPVEWNVARVLSLHRVANALHVEIAAHDPSEPSLRVEVDAANFEARLDEARAAFGAGSAARSWVRRLGIKGWLSIAAIVIPLSWFVVTLLLPRAHVLISRDTEDALGAAVCRSFLEGQTLIEDAELTALIGRMTAELADAELAFDLRVTVVDDATPNAFAAPGGHIVVFAGLLEHCPNADTLAAVLAHEIVHVEQRHGLKHLLRTLGLLYFASCVIGGGVEEFATAETTAEMSSVLVAFKHSREHEREADRLGVEKLRRARRRASGLVDFFDSMDRDHRLRALARRLKWLSTHPLDEERIAEVKRLAGPPDPREQPWIEPEAWQALVERVTK